MSINSTNLALFTPLHGHTTPETAKVVDDYPYGYTLRCKIRYWLETKQGHGDRFVSQTSNPKRPGEVWNKPKAGTYNAGVTCMAIEKSTGHVTHVGVSAYGWSKNDEIDAFVEWAGGIDKFNEQQQRTLMAMRNYNDAVAKREAAQAAA